MRGFFLIVIIGLVVSGCFRVLPSQGGGQVSGEIQGHKPDPTDIRLPEGYKIEPVATGLTFPTAVAFDEAGQLYGIEAGYSYGEVFLHPKLIQIDTNGRVTEIYVGEKNGPWNGFAYYDGYFYIAEGGQLEGGKILKVSKEGVVEVLVDGLPSLGDHHTNGPLVMDGYLYFAQGTATNSGVVGNDNAHYGWLYRNTEFHDIPCEDIRVTGTNYTTDNVLTEDAGDEAVTGPFSPYNEQVRENQVIQGSVPCSGAIMRVPLNGGDPEVVAWGFRNPYGMAAAPDGSIYIVQNGYDVRGSRPLWGTADLLWKLEEEAWYGWPDFSGRHAAELYKVPGEDKPERLLATHFDLPPAPIVEFAVHSSSCGIDFSHSRTFGFQGQAFVAQFGDMAPTVGKVLSPVGFKVVRVDVAKGIVEDFAVNKGKGSGPASLLKNGGLERPVSVQFDPKGSALYIVDFGVVTMQKKGGANPHQKTGVIWKVTKVD